MQAWRLAGLYLIRMVSLQIVQIAELQVDCAHNVRKQPLSRKLIKIAP
jgi:hypothetical protein